METDKGFLELCVDAFNRRLLRVKYYAKCRHHIVKKAFKMCTYMGEGSIQGSTKIKLEMSYYG